MEISHLIVIACSWASDCRLGVCLCTAECW